MRKQLPSLETVRSEKSRRRLADFLRYGWHVLEPSTPLEWNWHLDAMCDHLQAALDDWLAVQQWRARPVGECPAQRIKDMILNVPPGTMKSRVVSVYAPAWMWLKCPSWRAIFISGNPRVSERDSAYCRTLIQSDWYQEWFTPDWQITGDQNAKTYYRNTARGERRAIGAKSRLTGDRADAIFVDDPNDAAEVESDAERDAVNNWWDQGAGNRVNDLRTSVRIGIQQRLHEDDWTGHVLPLGKWEHIVIPMEYDQSVARVTPIGWRDPRATVGELMMPDRFPPEVLAAERLRLGSNGYAGQYQQQPFAKGGTIFKGAWFEQRYRILPALKEVWTCWDLATKASEENDETACVTAAAGEDGNVYVLRMAHGRWETPDVAKFLIAQADWYRKAYGDRYRGDYVEDKQAGTTLIQYVRRDRPDLALIPAPVEADKVARANGVSPVCEGGRVLLPDPHIYPATFEWARDLLAQLTAFPKARHDDITDAFVYALKRFLGTIGGRKSRRSKRGGVV